MMKERVEYKMDKFDINILKNPEIQIISHMLQRMRE